MARKSAHVDKQLFDYLSGALGKGARETVEDHLLDCAECSSAVAVLRAVKSEFQNTAFDVEAEAHPDVSALASFFYRDSKGQPTGATAAHVAACRSCACELAEYVKAERAAIEYDTSGVRPGEIPAAAWERIRDWEQSSFAKPKAAGYAISQDLIGNLTRLLAERKEQLELSQPDTLTHPASGSERAGLVPVIVVDRSGGLRGVEMFEKATDAQGAEVLSYPGESDRFDKKPFHALLDFGDKNRVVVSDLILRDKIRLPRVERSDAELCGADYFIIED